MICLHKLVPEQWQTEGVHILNCLLSIYQQQWSDYLFMKAVQYASEEGKKAIKELA